MAEMVVLWAKLASLAKPDLFV